MRHFTHGKKVVVMGLLLLLVAFAAATLAYTDAFAFMPTEEHQDPPPSGGGGGGGCNYCNLTACGCTQPSAGCVLYFGCTCSSLTCTRTCTFDC